MKRLFLVMWRISRNDLKLLWFALKHRDRPIWLLPAAIALTLYALAPFNLVIPLLGIVDDMILVPLALHYLLRFLPRSVADSFTQRDAVNVNLQRSH